MIFDFNSHLLAREVHLTGQAGLENASSGARRISHKVVQMDWSPIVNRQGTVEKVLLITQDVTHLRELEESAALRKDELDIISKLIRVPAEKFNDFVDSASRYIAENRRLITAAASRDPEVVAALFRNMHTVKGNARMFEFTHITNAAHHAEHTYELLRASGTGVLNVQTLHDELNAVEAGVAQYLRVNEDTLGRRRRTTDMLASRGAFVADEQLAALRAMAASVTREHPNADVVQLQREIDQLGLVSLAQIVSGAAESLSSLARELNKPTPTLEMANVDVALNRRFAAALESCCVHIFRNSLDHGIERPRDRTMANKPAPGRLHFTCEQLTGQLELRIGDDGQGLALQRLYERGKAAGLFGSEERPSRAAVADLIFHAGLSTAARVTQVSGRGVGMDAVRKLLEDQGATIRIALEELSGVEFGFAPFELFIHVPSAAYSR
jgi:chemotaxis protein histidine kinase CheA